MSTLTMDFAAGDLRVFEGMAGNRGIVQDFQSETVRLRVGDLLEPKVEIWKGIFEREMVSLTLAYEEGHFSTVISKGPQIHAIAERLRKMGAPVANKKLAKIEEILVGAEMEQETGCKKSWN